MDEQPVAILQQGMKLMVPSVAWALPIEYQLATEDESRVKTYLEWEHVLLQINVSLCHDGLLNTILRAPGASFAR